MTDQCKFIKFNKRTTLVGVTNTGVVGEGREISEKSLYFLLNFAMDLKLL